MWAMSFVKQVAIVLNETRIIAAKASLYSALLGSCVCFACTSRTDQGPQMISAAEFSGYAVNYPSQLTQLTEKYQTLRDEAQENSTALESYPSKLETSNWDLVSTIYERADKSGRTEPYAQAVADDEILEDFFDSERDELARRVNGAVKNSLDKALCTCELEAYGKIVYAIKDSSTKSRAKKLEEKNEAYHLLDRFLRELGKKNSEVLKSQIDIIAHTSYITFVGLPTINLKIQHLLDEARDVEKSIEKALESEREFVSNPPLEQPERKAAEKRITILENAKVSLGPALEAAKTLLSQTEKEILSMRQGYEDALEKLQWAVEQKRKTQERKDS